MSYKIVGDSCLDLPESLKNDPHFVRVPLTIQLGFQTIPDDESFDQKDFLEKLEKSPEHPKTACPSPMKYMEAYEGEEQCVFVVTLSSALSGSYDSALQAKRLYEEKHGKEAKKIEIIDSESASAGQFRIALFIRQLCDQGLKFEEIKKQATELRNGMKTYFVLDNLELLKKSGRLSGLKGKIIDVLNLKLVMGTEKGQIKKITQTRGIQKALQKMCETVASEAQNIRGKVLVVSHINSPERAEFVKNEIKKYGILKDIITVNGGGISTVYAGNGGIILAM